MKYQKSKLGYLETLKLACHHPSLVEKHPKTAEISADMHTHTHTHTDRQTETYGFPYYIRNPTSISQLEVFVGLL